jgi:hypothetical protein
MLNKYRDSQLTPLIRALLDGIPTFAALKTNGVTVEEITAAFKGWHSAVDKAVVAATVKRLVADPVIQIVKSGNTTQPPTPRDAKTPGKTQAQRRRHGNVKQLTLKDGTAEGLERAFAPAPVLTSYQGNNDLLLAQAAKLYLRPGNRIADVTYGKGVFWRQIDLAQYDFHPSDLLTVPEHPHDFRRLPYRSADFDVHVFDPPYIHHPRAGRYMEADYRNHQTTKGFSHDDIIQLFRDGMIEGHRILKPGGLMLVKCKDEIESGKQKITHIEIHDIAVNELRMEVQDTFVPTQKQPVMYGGQPQQHAWKNHSYLWVFKKKKKV